MNANNYAYFRPGWSPITVLAMVLGFVVFWPLGLAVLAYILWGERFGWSPANAERWVNRQKQAGGWCRGGDQARRNHGFSAWGNGPSSGNAAFDTYREEQLKRLDEERRRLDEEVGEFHDYMRNLRMARDREEFDRFLRDRQNRQTGGQNDNPPTNV